MFKIVDGSGDHFIQVSVVAKIDHEAGRAIVRRVRYIIADQQLLANHPPEKAVSRQFGFETSRQLAGTDGRFACIRVVKPDVNPH
jgi:hypothetical protein